MGAVASSREGRHTFPGGIDVAAAKNNPRSLRTVHTTRAYPWMKAPYDWYIGLRHHRDGTKSCYPMLGICDVVNWPNQGALGW